MSSPASKHTEEAEFDDLLGQLVDELAMTPASESAVQLVPDPLPVAEAHVDSTNRLAVEAAAAAQARMAARAESNNLLKIVGIIATSVTVVAVAALAVFGAPGVDGDAADDDQALADASGQVGAEELDQNARAERAAAEQARIASIAAERAELEAQYVRTEAERLANQAKAEAATKPKAKPKPRRRSRPKAKPKPKSGDSFDDL